MSRPTKDPQKDLPPQDALSGDSKTLMFVNASPAEEDAPETACSLAFASRVRGVELGRPKKHVEPGQEVRALRGEISTLQDQVIINPAGP